MSNLPVQVLQLHKSFPCVRIGDGPQPLAVFPGINDALQPVTAAPRFWARLCRPFLAGRTAWVIGRRRGIPPGTSTRDLAGEYAEVLAGFGAAADVIGLSMGGMIAQHLAADHPALVRRLVLAVTTARPDEAKRELYRRWLERVRGGDWRGAYAEMIAKSYAACTTDCASAWLTVSPKAVIRQELDPADLERSIEACIGHEARDRLGALACPTLVMGGTEDLLVSPDAVRELAGAIPHAQLALLAGAGHGLFDQKPVECGRLVRDFLDDDRRSKIEDQRSQGKGV
jgi:pimeloyl-ACP methyl ester carboxylesterase